MSGVFGRNLRKRIVIGKRTASVSGGFVVRKPAPKIGSIGKIGLGFVIFMMLTGIIASGAFYLYQVNSIAVQGYEMKKVENRIQVLEKENQKLKIQEVESKSMYNIEKSTEDLNLVSSLEISYIEVKGPMAMK